MGNIKTADVCLLTFVCIRFLGRHPALLNSAFFLRSLTGQGCEEGVTPCHTF